MQRITISIDDALLATIDRLCERRGYQSRSEALRDIVREAEGRERAMEKGTPCYATLSYMFEHDTRDLARRLTNAQHHRHDLSISTLHVHVDHADCLEVAILKGSVEDVTAFADSVVTQRGVRFGNLHVIPVAETDHHHRHDHEHHHPPKT